MEKRTPHCALTKVKEMVGAGKLVLTFAAQSGGVALGFDYDGIKDLVLALTMRDFYKSMTTHQDYRRWQDVYRPTTAAGLIYLKLMVAEDVVVVSFKEL